jgi:hypothetical protein
MRWLRRMRDPRNAYSHVMTSYACSSSVTEFRRGCAEDLLTESDDDQMTHLKPKARSFLTLCPDIGSMEPGEVLTGCAAFFLSVTGSAGPSKPKRRDRGIQEAYAAISSIRFILEECVVR